MRVLIAPDKFKHALSASGVCEAIARGIRAAFPAVDIHLCPLADGGEGTAEILATCGGSRHQSVSYQQLTAAVQDPLGRSTQAVWWWDNQNKRGLVELARASGLHLLRPEERNPLRTSTYGTGQLMDAALLRGARQVQLAVGGSATVDGGTGILQALGWQFADETGNTFSAPIRGGELARLRSVRPPSPMPHASFVVLADVDNPLLGPRGAARTYAPQKGADAEAVVELERGLENWAGLLRRWPHAASIDFQQSPLLGAAGGVPAGLAVEFGATVARGFDAVATACDLRARLERADVCITGEGQLDHQTLHGKVVGGVAGMAALAGVPCIAIVGRIADPPPVAKRLAEQLGLAAVFPLSDPNDPPAEAMAGTSQNLERVAAEVVRAFMMSRGGT